MNARDAQQPEEDPTAVEDINRLLRRVPKGSEEEPGVKSSSLESSEDRVVNKGREMTRPYTNIKTVNWQLTNS